MNQFSRRAVVGAIAATLFASCGSALAAFPDKPIKMIVPYGGGGMGSVFANMVGELLGERLKQPVVPDYKPGANAMIGTEFAAKAPADGYTLLMVTTSSLTVNPVFRKNVRYDPIKDFTPVSMVWVARNVLYTPTKIKTLKELIDEGQKKSLNYGSLGAGSLAHLSSEMLVREAHLKPPVHLPFKGNGPVMTEVAAGRIDFAFGDTSGLQLAQAGKVQAVAVTGDTRVSAAPTVPTLKELGYPNVGTASWIGIVAPHGTPQAVVDQISKALHEAFSDESVRKKVEALGVEVAPDQSPAYFDKAIHSEIQRWKQFQADTKISVD